MTTLEIMKRAKAAAPELAVASTAQKNRALERMAESLLAHTPDILAANAQDVEVARGHISEVMLDRLALTQARVEAMAEGLRQVAALPDPVGRALRQVERPNGLRITRVSVPLGVVAGIGVAVYAYFVWKNSEKKKEEEQKQNDQDSMK